MAYPLQRHQIRQTVARAVDSSSPANIGRRNSDQVADDRFVKLSTLAPGSRARARLRAQLIMEFRPLAHRLAARYRQRSEPTDDLEQVAMIGLVNAIDRFDADRGHSFVAFAVPTVIGELTRHFRDRTWIVQVPRSLKETHLAVRAAAEELTQARGAAPSPSAIAEHLDIPVSDVCESLNLGSAYTSDSLDLPLPEDSTRTVADTIGGHDPNFDLVDDRVSAEPLIGALSEPQRVMLKMRFLEQKTQSEIAHRFGISQMQVSRHLSHIIALLRSRI